MIHVRASSNDPGSVRLLCMLAERLHNGSEFVDGQTAVVDVATMGAPEKTRSGSYPLTADVLRCPVRLLHSWAVIGPFGRRARPCSQCLFLRWLALQPRNQAKALRHADNWHTNASPWLSEFAADLISETVTGILESPDHPTEGESFSPIYALNLETFEVRRYYLMADSSCSQCYQPAADGPDIASVSLQEVPKPDSATYRSKTLRDIPLTAEAFLNPICGVLGPDLGRNQHHNFSSPVAGIFRDSVGGHAPTSWGGHTATFDTSLKAGLLEGLERHAGLQPRSRRLAVHDSLANLGEEALDPRTCGVYETATFRFDTTLTPFTPDLKVNWIWGYSLTRQKPVLVPSQMVFYGRRPSGEPAFVRHNSSGCASGSSLEEAILHGLIELIERDTFVITWLAKLAPPRIDPLSCRKPETRHLLNRLERLGYDVHLLDMRLDLPIPSVTGFIQRRDRKLGALVAGAGAHMNPDTAVHTALAELTSYTMDFDLRVQDDEATARALMADYSRVHDLEHHSLLYGLPEMADRIGFLTANPECRSVAETYRDWEAARPLNRHLLGDLEYCLSLLSGIGLNEVVVVDQSSPEQAAFGIKTVCVIVPGLMPIDFGYHYRRASSLDRLYTVPRLVGARATELTPGELNDLPHFFP